MALLVCRRFYNVYPNLKLDYYDYLSPHFCLFYRYCWRRFSNIYLNFKLGYYYYHYLSSTSIKMHSQKQLLTILIFLFHLPHIYTFQDHFYMTILTIAQVLITSLKVLCSISKFWKKNVKNWKKNIFFCFLEKMKKKIFFV